MAQLEAYFLDDLMDSSASWNVASALALASCQHSLALFYLTFQVKDFGESFHLEV